MITKQMEIHYVKVTPWGKITFYRDELGRICKGESEQKPTCHPDKEFYALGYCRNCYEKNLRERNPEFAQRQRDNCKKWGIMNEDLVKSGGLRYRERIKTQNPELYYSRQRRKNLRIYGITERDYEEMFSRQNGVCFICKIPPTGKYLLIDHNHKTKKVRALLCKSCNFLVGTIEKRQEEIKKVEQYLVKFNE